MADTISIFWFRRDLRLQDNAGLYHALRSGHRVVPVFIFDTNILDDLKEKKDKRVAFIHDTLVEIQDKLKKHHSSLHVLHGEPLQCFKQLLEHYHIHAVYTNNDYEPYAIKRDEQIRKLLQQHNISFHSYKDQVIFEREEVLKDDKTPYTIYTPYSKRWKSLLNNFYLKSYPTEKYLSNLYKQDPRRTPSLESMGFEKVKYDIVPAELNHITAKNYDKERDYPAMDGTTRLGIHLRFGTVSIRQIASEAKRLNEKLLDELIWREFYQQVLWHFPNVVTHSFRKEFDNIRWRNNEKEFQLWCSGQTGFPIVDAGMRELNETGYMPNRVRMIVASFLIKDLLIDWRWGEAYFAEKLLDYDLASNNGNWQWVAGTGCDAAPYFRVFNPTLQTEKFDPKHEYIKRWVPENDTVSYPAQIVEHNEAKKRCIDAYNKAVKR
ncbi:MAG TPA: deoxyribodipyrimidine photo-lyase [Flavipsychrobacter sp.]|nr:deoxyribodipyrimidine photo-lyase [Flavipsychrobacter sp.]